MTTLLLIRHGQSVANLERRFAGSSDFPLTQLGQMQAAYTAEFVAANYAVDAVYSSDLRRAYDTGRATADKLGLPITTDPELREIFAGAWEGVPFDDITRDHYEDITLFRQNVYFSRCTDGESVVDMIARIRGAIDRIAEKHDGQTVAIACHGTPIRSLIWMGDDLPPEKMQEVPWPGNASVSEFTWDKGKLTLVHASQEDHLAGLNTTIDLK